MTEGNGRGNLAWQLHHDALGGLVLTDALGRAHPVAGGGRAFPLSMPRRGGAVVGGGGKGPGWGEELRGPPAGGRPGREEQLAEREFVPVIRRVLWVSAVVEPSEWEVETDRGRTRFLLKSEDDVHPLDEWTALITDAHGVRYLIPDTRQLDPASRRRLERFL